MEIVLPVIQKRSMPVRWLCFLMKYQPTGDLVKTSSPKGEHERLPIRRWG
ncbi:hypothetical protein ACLK2A_10340 [Escherichia coli]